MANKTFQNAKIAKEDEFYTKITDIEKELKHYKEQFKDKVIFCNCDDPETSNFWKYFELQFDDLGIKKLVSTHFDPEKPTYKLELMCDIDGDGKRTKKDIVKTPLQQNGDFRSPESIEILKEADIVITNPPFSLFKQYLAQLIEYEKKFLIIGSQNNITYKEIFPLIQQNKIWLGYYAGDMEFIVPDYYEPRETRYREENGIKYRSMGNICWYSNLDVSKRYENITLYKMYNPADYPKYDNYNAIECKRVELIPIDYYDTIGVPITFLYKYNPNQFEIIGNSSTLAGAIKDKETGKIKNNPQRFYLDGKRLFDRIVIRRKG